MKRRGGRELVCDVEHDVPSQALGTGVGEASRPDQVSFVEARHSLKRKGKERVTVKSREWILAKKERAKRQGKE